MATNQAAAWVDPWGGRVTGEAIVEPVTTTTDWTHFTKSVQDGMPQYVGSGDINHILDNMLKSLNNPATGIIGKDNNEVSQGIARETIKTALDSVTGATQATLSRKGIFRNVFDVPARSHIVIVGCGGTGGYVIPHVARLAYGLVPKGKEIKITLVDPDKVEEKNVLRQNFVESDIGEYKADVLAERYSSAFGLEIATVTEYATAKLLDELWRNADPRVRNSRLPLLLIGCVDNNKARREFHKFFKEGGGTPYGSSYVELIGWLDSGNEKENGQVVLGSFYKGSTYYLPFVTQLYPEILDETKDPKEKEVNCATRAAEDIQNIFVNLTAATHVLNLVNMIYSAKKTSIHGVEFGLLGATSPTFLKVGKTVREIDVKETLWK